MKIRTLSWLMIGGVLSAVLIYGCVLLALTWPISEFSISSSGVFGDSFGVLTSLFSGLAFAGLIITIVMQRDELALQRQELNLTREELSGQKEEMRAQNETLKVQRFESTFFKMLDFLEGCRRDVFYQGFQGPAVEGRDAIKALYDAFTENFLCKWVQDSSLEYKMVFKDECKTLEGVSVEYSNFYAKYGDELGQYYRTLYNLLKLVDRAEFVDDKTVYTNLVRAQLSRYELLLLFYNCISRFGIEKMAPLIKRYNILKHIENTMLPVENKKIWDMFNE
ncbi:putative phage abortive infection protein [Rheinheimera tilapiae]|uniref:Phage abortive infection protein n=1 Tax=Rheinheimera tilapiae TaxID=875043 RepID=A0ABV6B927_9GAMM